MTWSDRIGWRTWLSIAGALLAIQALGLHALGRLTMSRSGALELWHGGAFDSGTSQQIADWYSFPHVVAGVVLYGIFARLMPRRPAGLRFVFTTLTEVAWELAENTSFIMDRYRTYTLSLNYYGDTIVNSVADVVFCLAGFALARRLPVRMTIALAVALELFVVWTIRDNGTLNTIMLIHPLETIRRWQSATGW
jgi:hypothetical protein